MSGVVTRGSQLSEAASDADDPIAVLYRRYYHPMLSWARRTLDDPNAAEDVVHSVFASALHALASPSHCPIAGGYLFVALRRECNREKQRRVAMPEIELALIDVLSEMVRLTDDERVAEDQSEWLARALAALPERRRAVLRDWLDGYSYQEIALRSNIAVTTVDAQLQLARSTLRQLATVERERERESVRETK